MLAPSAIDQWFESWSGQTNDYKMCCFFAERAALGSKIKDWLACYQDNLPKWSNMSTRGMLFLQVTRTNMATPGLLSGQISDALRR
jgi:predicted oxidoreductase (fatty acid repression mutant protein)